VPVTFLPKPHLDERQHYARKKRNQGRTPEHSMRCHVWFQLKEPIMDNELKKLQKDPPEGSRELIERELERSDDDAPDSSGQEGRSGQVPDAAGVEGMQSIRSIDLSLHSDGINHWQDEPRRSPKPDVVSPRLMKQPTSDTPQKLRPRAVHNKGSAKFSRDAGLAIEVGPAQPYDVDHAEKDPDPSDQPLPTEKRS
jgi:hypothetical protein